MNLRSVFKYASKNTPNIPINYKDGWFRDDVTSLLKGENNIGIELGVAKGVYSKKMLDSDKFHRFYGVDLYGGTHDTKEYCEALKYIGHTSPRYCLLRMDFDSALELFDDDYFDFIYIDGFAHTGEEGGETLVKWIKKLKMGGVFAGDDYHDNWPLVKWAVNDLVKKLDAELFVTTEVGGSDYCKYPTWFIKKNSYTEVAINTDLHRISMKEKRRIYNQYYAEGGFFREVKRKSERLIGRALSTIGLKEFVIELLSRYR